MNDEIRIGVVGDQLAEFHAPQQAVGKMVEMAAAELKIRARVVWVPTPLLVQGRVEAELEPMDALWCSPGSPYLSLEGALAGIRFAREREWPFIGTCAGFQHAVLEYARNVMGLKDAASVEYDPNATTQLVTPLKCPVASKTLKINLAAGSRAFQVYGREQIEEYYYCQYGLNPDFQLDLDKTGLKVVGVDEDGEARVLELPKHRFFIVTLFVPGASFLERSIEMKSAHPLVKALLSAAVSFRAERKDLHLAGAM